MSDNKSSEREGKTTMLSEMTTTRRDRRVFLEDNGKADMELIVWIAHGAFCGFQLVDGKDVLKYDGKEFGEYLQTSDLGPFGIGSTTNLNIRNDWDPIYLNAMLNHFTEKSKNLPTNVRDYVVRKIKEHRRMKKPGLLSKALKKRRTS
jgi:hypothetical protein